MRGKVYDIGQGVGNKEQRCEPGIIPSLVVVTYSNFDACPLRLYLI